MIPNGNSHQELIRRRDESTASLSTSSVPLRFLDSQESSTSVISAAKNYDHEFSRQFSMALTIAGMGLSLLVTIFALFHVDVFLRVYRLPLRAYSTGNLFITVVNTFNDLVGAFFLDAAATKMNRSDLIGLAGVLLSLGFL